MWSDFVVLFRSWLQQPFEDIKYQHAAVQTSKRYNSRVWMKQKCELGPLHQPRTENTSFQLSCVGEKRLFFFKCADQKRERDQT